MCFLCRFCHVMGWYLRALFGLVGAGSVSWKLKPFVSLGRLILRVFGVFGVLVQMLRLCLVQVGLPSSAGVDDSAEFAAIVRSGVDLSGDMPSGRALVQVSGFGGKELFRGDLVSEDVSLVQYPLVPLEEDHGQAVVLSSSQWSGVSGLDACAHTSSGSGSSSSEWYGQVQRPFGGASLVSLHGRVGSGAGASIGLRGAGFFHGAVEGAVFGSPGGIVQEEAVTASRIILAENGPGLGAQSSHRSVDADEAVMCLRAAFEELEPCSESWCN